MCTTSSGPSWWTGEFCPSLWQSEQRPTADEGSLLQGSPAPLLGTEHSWPRADSPRPWARASGPNRVFLLQCPHHFWNPPAPARDVRVCTPRQACGGPGPGVLPGDGAGSPWGAWPGGCAVDPRVCSACRASLLLLTWAPGQGGVWAVPRGPVDVRPDPMPGPRPLPSGQHGAAGTVRGAGGGVLCPTCWMEWQIKDFCWCSLLCLVNVLGGSALGGER